LKNHLAGLTDVVVFRKLGWKGEKRKQWQPAKFALLGIAVRAEMSLLEFGPKLIVFVFCLVAAPSGSG